MFSVRAWITESMNQPSLAFVPAGHIMLSSNPETIKAKQKHDCIKHACGGPLYCIWSSEAQHGVDDWQEGEAWKQEFISIILTVLKFLLFCCKFMDHFTLSEKKSIYVCIWTGHRMQTEGLETADLNFLKTMTIDTPCLRSALHSSALNFRFSLNRYKVVLINAGPSDAGGVDRCVKMTSLMR